MTLIAVGSPAIVDGKIAFQDLALFVEPTMSIGGSTSAVSHHLPVIMRRKPPENAIAA